MSKETTTATTTTTSGATTQHGTPQIQVTDIDEDSLYFDAENGVLEYEVWGYDSKGEYGSQTFKAEILNDGNIYVRGRTPDGRRHFVSQETLDQFKADRAQDQQELESIANNTVYDTETGYVYFKNKDGQTFPCNDDGTKYYKDLNGGDAIPVPQHVLDKMQRLNNHQSLAGAGAGASVGEPTTTTTTTTTQSPPQPVVNAHNAQHELQQTSSARINPLEAELNKLISKEQYKQASQTIANLVADTGKGADEKDAQVVANTAEEVKKCGKKKWKSPKEFGAAVTQILGDACAYVTKPTAQLITKIRDTVQKLLGKKKTRSTHVSKLQSSKRGKSSSCSR